MAKHTPGPWRKGAVGHSVVSDAPIESGLSGANDVEYYGGHLIAESVSPTNVPVICAAPELLWALRQIIQGLPSNRDWLDPDIERVAKEAIKKAEGR